MELSQSSDDWIELAACQDEDPELFFPGRGMNTQLRAAKAVCAFCAVKEECLEFALENGIKHGVWGGKSERERRRIRRERRAGV